MPLAHTVELNAGTMETGTDPYLYATWTWATSAFDYNEISRLNRLWFEALTGICAHVRNGGGGLTPSDIAPARLSQHQIDELCQHDRVIDILPLTSLQEGLLFHASASRNSADLRDVYAVQLEIGLSGQLDVDRLREAVQTVVTRHPNLAARFCQQFDRAVQVLLADPNVPWRYDDLNSDEEIQALCADERAAVCDLSEPVFRAALIRTACDRHRVVLTFHHIVLDGWSLPILAHEIFAGYYRQRLPAPVMYRRFVAWLAAQDDDAARTAWREVFDGFETPTLVAPPSRFGSGRREVASVKLSETTTQALSALARSCHTTVSTVLHAAWAQILMWLTGQHDVAFGTAVSGRPTELAGSESMVGLLINTVPVRATITAATTTADLLEQLQRNHNHILEHQHLALGEIHRATGREQLFDSLFVYENYPIDTTALLKHNGLAITEIIPRECNHYPLSVQAIPGHELGLRVEFDTGVFDAQSIDRLIARFERVLVAMTAGSGSM
jgi:hypothetical protein